MQATCITAAITDLETASFVTLTTGIGIPVIITLATADIVLGVFSAPILKIQKVFESKAKKHEKIKFLAESKLDSISSLFSKAVENKHYRTLKEQIRSKSKKVVDTITNEQRAVILVEGRK